MHYIYSISIRGRVIYIGRTKSPISRFKSHISCAIGVIPVNKNRKIECLYSYMLYSLSVGRVPRFEVISSHEDCDINGKEKEAIRRYKPRFNNHGNGSILDYRMKPKKYIKVPITTAVTRKEFRVKMLKASNIIK